MNKDAILATLIGLALGLGIAGTFIFGPRLLRALPRMKLPSVTLTKPVPKATPQPTPTPKAFAVTITAPLADAIEPQKDVVVSGVVTQGGATVVIAGLADEDVVVAAADGAYAGKVTAVEGKNDIIVTAYGSGGEKAQATVTIYYTQERL